MPFNSKSPTDDAFQLRSDVASRGTDRPPRQTPLPAGVPPAEPPSNATAGARRCTAGAATRRGAGSAGASAAGKGGTTACCRFGRARRCISRRARCVPIHWSPYDRVRVVNADSLRTLPGVSLRPHLAFNPRLGAFQRQLTPFNSTHPVPESQPGGRLRRSMRRRGQSDSRRRRRPRPRRARAVHRAVPRDRRVRAHARAQAPRGGGRRRRNKRRSPGRRGESRGDRVGARRVVVRRDRRLRRRRRRRDLPGRDRETQARPRGGGRRVRVPHHARL